ncbi:MAG: tetratricopeptide repeat protein [Deltaproteobacteria bacterium]|nr:tetratricopeptide repeat protein [Deltaproteobacteria bacterium]
MTDPELNAGAGEAGLWQRAQAVFFEAIEVEGPRREALIEEACAGDKELSRAVRALLAGHEDVGVVDDLAAEEGPLGGIQERVRALAPVSVEPGDVIGVFRVVDKLGEGGMASVYRARRMTEDFHQEVALKVLRRRDLNEEMVLRFSIERQIAASLDHPNISKLIDGGVTEDGRPYFAMELVSGLPLDEYCDTHNLPLRQRVGLIIEVAQAVHYAHRNLLVHRDLKPSNILVDETGRVRLLDFGIAKQLDPDSVVSARTQTGALLLTPRYSSPEQFTGGAITTSSDQYQLGLLLFELVTGHCHHLLEGEDLGSMGRRITDLDTPRPSRLLTSSSRTSSFGISSSTGDRSMRDIAAARSATVTELARQVHGDLDTIVLKTLEKNPDRRYASVEALVEDLQRFLANEPVQARPMSFLYRARKFTHRHRLAVAASGIALTALVVGATIATWQAVRATRAEQMALEEVATSTQVSDFLVDLFEVSDPENARGGDLTASEILERGRQRIEGELADQPLIQARMMGKIAEIHRKLGLYQEAVPLAEKALESQRRIRGTRAPEVAVALRALGRLQADSGDDASAEPSLRGAEEIFVAELGATSVERAETLLDLGSLEYRRADLAAAEETYLRGQSLLEASDQASPEQRMAAAEALGTLYFAKRELGKAEALQRQVLAFREQEFDRDHPDLAKALSSLANTLGWQGRDSEAAPLHQRAVEVLEQVYGPDHRSVSEALIRLASLLGRMGRLDEAEVAFLRAAEIKAAVFGPEHPQTVGSTLNLGRIHSLQGEYDQAERQFRRALEAAAKGLGTSHPLYGFSHHELAGVFRDLSRYDEAEEHYRKALQVLEAAFGPTNPRLAEPVAGLAFIEMKRDRLEAAKSLYERALGIQQAAFDGDKPPLANTLNGLGTISRLEGDFSAAKAFHQRAHDAWAAAYNESHPAAGKALSFLAQVLLDEGDLETAFETYQKALTIADTAHGPDHLESLLAIDGLVILARKRGDLPGAVKLQQRALSIRQASYGLENPEVAQAAAALSELRAEAQPPS